MTPSSSVVSATSIVGTPAPTFNEGKFRSWLRDHKLGSFSRLTVAIQYQLYAIIVRNKTADVRKCRRSADYGGLSEGADRGHGRSHRPNGEGRLCPLYLAF